MSDTASDPNQQAAERLAMANKLLEAGSIIDQLKRERDQLRERVRQLEAALQRVWDEDECGYIIDETGFKECVKCGAKMHLKEPHTEDCTQGFIDEILFHAQPIKP